MRAGRSPLLWVSETWSTWGRKWFRPHIHGHPFCSRTREAGYSEGKYSGGDWAGTDPPRLATQKPVAPVPQALFLRLLGAQGSAPNPSCDCAYNFPKRDGLHCCRGCPAGHYLKAPCTEPCGHATCLPCPRGTFLARENHHESRCARCQACDEQGSQVALKNCSAVADTHCGCEPGWFLECKVIHCIESSPFSCRPCKDCGALHRHTQVPCEYPTEGCLPLRLPAFLSPMPSLGLQVPAETPTVGPACLASMNMATTACPAPRNC